MEHTGDHNFTVLVPWLMLVATLLILLQLVLVRWGHLGPRSGFAPVLWTVAVVAFVVAASDDSFEICIDISSVSTWRGYRKVKTAKRTLWRPCTANLFCTGSVPRFVHKTGGEEVRVMAPPPTRAVAEALDNVQGIEEKMVLDATNLVGAEPQRVSR